MAQVSLIRWLAVTALIITLACQPSEASSNPFAGLEKIAGRRGQSNTVEHIGIPFAAHNELVEVSATSTSTSRSKTTDTAGAADAASTTDSVGNKITDAAREKGWFFSRARDALVALRRGRGQSGAAQDRKTLQSRRQRQQEDSIKATHAVQRAERERITEEADKAVERQRVATNEQAVKDIEATAVRQAEEESKARQRDSEQAAEEAFKMQAAAVAEQERNRTASEEQRKHTVAEEAAKGAAEEVREEAAKVEEKRHQEGAIKAAEIRRAHDFEQAAALAVAEEATKAEAVAKLTKSQNAAVSRNGQGNATDEEWANATIAGVVTTVQHLSPAQAITCTPTDITNDFLDAAIRAAQQAAAAAGNAAVAQLESAFDDAVAAAQSGSATVSVVYDEVGDVVSGSLGASIAGIEDATVPFCLKLPIAGQDVFFSGRVMVSVDSRALSGVLTLLTHIELASYMFVTAARLAVTGLSASRPLCGTGGGQPACDATSFRPSIDSVVVSGSFCGGAAQTCLRPLGDTEANAKRILGTMMMTHDRNVDTLVGTLPSVSVGQFAFVTVAGTSRGDEVEAQAFVNWLGLAADIGAHNAQLTVVRNRSTGAVVPTATFTPQFPSMDYIQERSCTLTPAFDPLVCSLHTARTFMQASSSNSAARCSMSLREDRDASNLLAPSVKTSSLACDNGVTGAAADAERQSMSMSYSRLGVAPPAYSGHLKMKGELFNMFSFVHFYDVHLSMRGRMGTGPDGGSHNATLSGQFCIGQTKDCEAATSTQTSEEAAASEALECVSDLAAGTVRQAKECRTLSGTMTLAHAPTRDHMSATLPLVKIAGIAYPLLQHSYGAETAIRFLSYLGPVADVGIRDATMSMTRSHGKLSPTLRGHPFFPSMAQVELNAGEDPCNVAHMSPLRCALKTLIGLDTESEMRTVLTVTAKADEQDDQGGGLVRIDLSHGNTQVQVEWQAGTLSATVMIDGEVFVLNGYAHVYDAHLSISAGLGQASGRFCLGSPENCAAEEAASTTKAGAAGVANATGVANVTEGESSSAALAAASEPLSEVERAMHNHHTISGSITVRHTGARGDEGEGHVERLVLGTFVDTNLRRVDNGGTVDTMLTALGDAVKSLEIRDARLNLVRMGPVLGLTIKGTPYLADPTVFACNGADWHPLSCALSQEAGRGADVTVALDTVITPKHSHVQVSVQTAPAGSSGGADTAGRIALVDHMGHGPSLFVGFDYPAAMSNRVEFGMKVGIRVAMGEVGAKHPVYFEGELTKSPDDPTIGGKLAMHGVWTGVAGIDYLHAADLVVGVNVVPTTPLVLTRLELGGEICLGSVQACYGEPLGGGRFLEQAEAQWTSKLASNARSPRQGRYLSRSLLQLANQEDSLDLTETDPECEQTDDELNGDACRTTCASTRDARKVNIPALVALVVDPTKCAVPRSQRTDAATGVIAACTEFRHVEVVEREASTGYLPCRGGISKRSAESAFLPPAHGTDPRADVRSEEIAAMVTQNVEGRTAPSGVFIKARAYISYNAKDPTKNFVMAMFSETTMSNLLDILAENGQPYMAALKTRLPPQLLVTGISPKKAACPTETTAGTGTKPAAALVHGDCCQQAHLHDMLNHPECFARFSYAPLRAQVIETSRGGSIAVPHGVAASGILHLLGHKIEAEIEISPTRFHVEGKMDPLTLGSVLTITRSETDTANGPRFLVDIQGGASSVSVDSVSSGIVQVELEGYLSIPFLQTSASVRMFLDGQKMVLEASLQMFGLFHADLEIEGSMATPPIGSFLARISGSCGKENPNAGVIKHLIVSQIGGLVNRAFEFVDKMSAKADEVLSMATQPAKICSKIFEGSEDRALRLREACKETVDTRIFRTALEELKGVVNVIQSMASDVKMKVIATLGIAESQADEFSNEAKAMAAQNADDATPASCSFFSLDFLELGGELTDDTNVIVRARAKFILLGKTYDETLSVDVRRLVDSFVEWVLGHFPSVNSVVRDIKATFDRAKNLFANTWDRLGDKLSAAALERESRRVFRELKGASGADTRDHISLAVSGDGRHLWAFDVEGRIAYKAGIGTNTFWHDIPGPESEVYGRSQINSISVSHDGQHVWCVTNGGYVFHRMGYNHAWNKVATGAVTNHDMRAVTVSGSGNKVWAIDDAPFHALGEELRNGDGGEIFERTGHIDSANVNNEDLWEDLSVSDGNTKCMRQPGNNDDECGLGIQGSANYDGSIYWMVTRQGAPWYYGPEKKWIEAPRPSYGPGGRRRLLLVEEKSREAEQRAEYESSGAASTTTTVRSVNEVKAQKTSRVTMLRSGVRGKSEKPASNTNPNGYFEPFVGRRTLTLKHLFAEPSTHALLALMESEATTAILKPAAQQEEGASAGKHGAHKVLMDAGLKSAGFVLSNGRNEGIGNRNRNAVSFLDMAAGTRIQGIAGGRACDENIECTSGFCGERWEGNCGCIFCVCGMCTHSSYTLGANAACGLDSECKFRYCEGNANGWAPTYGTGRCTSGENGAKCHDVHGCKTGHACVNGQCSNKAVGSACSSNTGCTSGRCDVTMGIANAANIDTKTCLHPAASRAGGLSCTLDDECQYGRCKGNSGGMTATPGTGRCTTGYPGAECGDRSDCKSGRCDETGMEGGIGTDKCLYPAESRLAGESCTLDGDCRWNFCAGNSGGMTTSWNTGTCTSGLPGAQCDDDIDCQGASECDNDLLGGINTHKCLYPPSSRKTGQQCTLNAECQADKCLGNSAGATTDWGSGKCGGGLKWITVSGDGNHVFGVADNGDVMVASRSTPYDRGRASSPFTWSAIPYNTKSMIQVLASNADGHPSSPALFGIDTSGDIHYRASLATGWVSIDEAQREKDRVEGAICACTHGTAATNRAQGCTSTGEHCHSCDAGWTLEPILHKCIKCLCEHGHAATAPSMCKAHGQVKCTSCDTGRYLVADGAGCHVNVCVCSDGTAAVGAQCTANAAHKCMSCHAGYTLDGITHRCVQDANQICVVDGQVKTTGSALVAAAAARKVGVTTANPLLVPRLSTSCRPSKRLVFSVNHNEYQNRVDVLPNGEVLWVAGTQTHDVGTSLAGLLFTVSPLNRHILALRPGYTSYGGQFGTVEYTLNRAAGHCQVEGVVVRAGAFGHMATLPEGCRPTRDLIFQVNNHASGARVDVDMTGQLKWVAGAADHDWLSLTGIHFSLVTSGENMLPLANGYTHFSSEFPGSGYKRATYALGSGGKLCTVQGVLVHHGKLNSGETMAILPAGCRPQRRLAFVVNQNKRSCRVDVVPNGEMVPQAGACDANTSWLSLAGIKFVTMPAADLAQQHTDVAVGVGWTDVGGEWGHVAEHVL